MRRAAAGKKLVLAVSGGRDSMALLHAAHRAAPRAIAAVATFDHATGPAATRAADLVARTATSLGFPVVVGRGAELESNENAWRSARLAFLSGAARKLDAVVATAHTRDDQIETVLMRVMRDAGARGLAGLYAPSEFLRPLLEFTRDEIATYAIAVDAQWIEDPTNVSMRFLRNRIRRDLLPAIENVDATLPAQLLAIADRSSRWRERIDAVVADFSKVDGSRRVATANAAALASLSAEELSVVWPAIAARVGLAMDWRGTERAAAFTKESRIGARVPLTGGWQILRDREHFILGRALTPLSADALELRSGLEWNGWKFLATRNHSHVSDQWVAQLPAGAAVMVRRWAPGDRMRVAAGAGARKVKRFLSDAHVSSAKRGEWPVVLIGKEIVWIPGVRRSDAAAVRPGRPGVLYRCELNSR